MEKISFVAMTFNEAENIGRCIDSVIGIADEIFILDSFSTDTTVEIAREKGAFVQVSEFRGYIEQRAYAIQSAKYDFVLTLDGDEWLSDELRDSILKIKSGAERKDCYFMNRCNHIGGQWLRHGSWYPDKKIRLFDRRKIKITGTQPHDHIEPLEGAATGFLQGDIMHFSDTDISSRYATINRHSTAAASAMYKKGTKPGWLRLLFKPPFRFIKEFFLKKGFMDGFYGFIIAKSSAQYVFLRESKLLELRRWEKGHRKSGEKSGR